MYVPTDSGDERDGANRGPAYWQNGPAVPVRWSGPVVPGEGAAQAGGVMPPAPYVPVTTPVRRSQPAPLRSGIWMSIGSFALSVALYAWLLGLPLGLGITVLLLIHELGHYVVIRMKGLPAALPVFIPLIGAYVAMRRWPSSVRDDAEIALAGPLAGCLSALGCVALYQITGIRLFLPLAALGYLLNLLNLVPILPLDGGRIANAISPWLSPVAFVGIVVYALRAGNLALLIVVLVFGLPSLLRVLSSSRNIPFYRITIWGRLGVALIYVALAAILFVGLQATLPYGALHLAARP